MLGGGNGVQAVTVSGGPVVTTARSKEAGHELMKVKLARTAVMH